MAFFSRKNEKPNTSGFAEQPAPASETEKTLNQLHQTRAMLNNIYNSICDIDFARIERKESLQKASITTFVESMNEETGEMEYVEVERSGVEVLNEIKSTITLLKKKLEAEDAAALLEQETAVIDSQLWKFAQTMNQALDSINVDLDTAKACLAGLLYGIMVGHSPIPESYDPDERENELTVRERKIEDYGKIVKVSKKIMNTRNSRNDIRRQNNMDILPKYKQAYAEYVDDSNNHRSLYDDIKGKNGREAQKMSPEHFAAWAKSALVVNLQRVHMHLKTQIVTFDDEMKRYEIAIENIKNAASVENMFYNEKLHREIDESISRIPDKMLVVLQNTDATQQSLDKMHNAFEAVLNSHDTKVGMTQTMNALEEITQEMERAKWRELDDQAARIAQLKAMAEKEKIEEELRQKLIDKHSEEEKGKVEDEVIEKITHENNVNAISPTVKTPPTIKPQHKVKKTK